MKTLALCTTLLAAAASPASAQESESLDELGSLAEIAQPFRPKVTLGPRAGFIKTRGADDGTWFAGAQVRIHLTDAFALEGSLTFHADEFQDGDVAVVQYPLEATALFYVHQGSPLKPYVLGGLGWYYTSIDIDTATFSDTSTSSTFGLHLGFGADLVVGDNGMTFNADLRYIYLRPDEDNLDDEEFDAIQVSLGLNFRM